MKLEKRPKVWLYLCTQLNCKHFFNEFEVKADDKPIGYYPCPACGCSAEWNGLNGRKLNDCIG